MPSPSRRTAIALAGAALALSAAGGATAANLITGRDVKDDSLTGADVRNGSLRIADLKAADRRALQGRSASDRIPSGTLVTGGFQISGSPGAGGRYDGTFQLPGRPGPGAEVVQDSDPRCRGTYLAPTAPAGVVCVYVNAIVNGAGLGPYLSFTGDTGGYGKVSGTVLVSDFTSAAGFASVEGSYAYRGN